MFRYSSSNPEILNKNENIVLNNNSQNFNFDISFQNSYWIKNPDRAFNSRFLGKCLLDGFKKQVVKTDFERFNKKKNCDFIVDVDLESGERKYEVCDKSELEINNEKYHYYVPVFFSRDVLTKYYSNPNRYTIEDNSISMKGSWMLDIDNNQLDCIVVYLGDLRLLPYQDQLYWKSHNINPKDGISSRKFQLDFLRKYSTPEIEDLKFKKLYKELNESWNRRYEFHLFVELSPNDIHCFESIRIPLRKEQAELDNLILNLTKIMVDYLNIKEINKKITKEDKSLPSIMKVEKYFKHINLDDVYSVILFLKQLQKLRSTGSAHRKSKEYIKALDAFGITNNNEIESFRIILKRANLILEQLVKFVN